VSHYRYSVTDPDDPRFQATGVIEGRELVVDLRVELESGERSAVLRAPEQLMKIMAHFAPRYNSVRTSWWIGENLMAFNRAIAAGDTPEVAATRTLLGRQVALAGYPRTKIRLLEGYPARYTKVVVSFSRSSSRPRSRTD
jgi:hypothetical protein